ncbi:hypothetical protein XBJ2_870090 [Xenorhabdus bovienii str. Jollieti]|uniref:Uncharacterized protein n=1 Tax=Xenorhabdus bovienii (strain SS-2004) TaxID=406818 RepID=D3V0W8_XENBS|nr:hypothetical protein XBJ1_1674 [Xenorhabdus bovienii SS-2004]CDH30511.1 hypothetical protein XBJ2_870090 [Xenorhabdus bovienii str. Jollieti]
MTFETLTTTAHLGAISYQTGINNFSINGCAKWAMHIVS